MKRDGLTDKQRRFIDEYLVDLNATAAAKRAGYSKRTACAIGKENLRKPPIAEEVARRIEDRAEETGITVEWVVKELRENVTFSKKLSSPSAAAQTLKILASHLGMDKKIIGEDKANPFGNRKYDMSKLTSKERKELARLLTKSAA